MAESEAMYDLVAATLCSMPAHSGTVKSAACAKGEDSALTSATTSAPAFLAVFPTVVNTFAPADAATPAVSSVQLSQTTTTRSGGRDCRARERTRRLAERTGSERRKEGRSRSSNRVARCPELTNRQR